MQKNKTVLAKPRKRSTLGFGTSENVPPRRHAQPLKLKKKGSGVTRVTHCVDVTGEDLLLERPHVLVQQMEPLGLVADLVHVNVAGGNIFVAALESGVLQANG